MTDFLYGSARVRTLENALIGAARTAVLLDAKNADELAERLHEYGVETPQEPSLSAWETVLAGRLQAAYDEVISLGGEADATRLWLYPYDCNNVKVAIKCFVRKIDARPMLFGFGSVVPQTLIGMVERGEFEGLPTAMRAAASRAMAEYAKTNNPQVIDLILDRACYEDMLAAAEQSGVFFAVRLVRQKIDLTNLMTCIRILRMQSGEMGKLLFGDAWIDGGFLPFETVRSWFEGGEAFLWERLSYSPYDRFANAVSGVDATLTEVERCSDNFFMEQIRTARYVSFGAEILIAYLLASEYEVRNLRILVAGKTAGLGTDVIRERIRESYV